MTGDEVERSIEFLFKNQATLEAQLERTSRQIEETNQRLEMYAETQTEFIQVVTRHIEAQGEINASLRGEIREIKVSLRDVAGELTAAQTRTDERLDKLGESQTRTDTQIKSLVESQMRTDERLEAMAESHARTDALLERLAKTVERFITQGRNGES